MSNCALMLQQQPYNSPAQCTGTDYRGTPYLATVRDDSPWMTAHILLLYHLITVTHLALLAQADIPVTFERSCSQGIRVIL